MNRLRCNKGLLIRTIRRIPDIPFGMDVNSVIPKRWEGLVDPEAIEYLCNGVFPTGEYLSLLYELQCARAEGHSSTEQRRSIMGYCLRWTTVINADCVQETTHCASTMMKRLYAVSSVPSGHGHIYTCHWHFSQGSCGGFNSRSAIIHTQDAVWPSRDISLRALFRSP
jgi:hypothetical protein